MKVLARLNHHNLVTLLDAGVDRTEPGPRVYLVMELVEGPDLRRRLQDGPLASRHAAQIGYDLADAITYIHDSGVVHRDVKPGNIMVFDYHHDAARMRAKLTDFGIALMADAPHLDTGGILGTAAYLSPEQAKAEPVGPASDVYSLGLVLLECLTGEPVFNNDPLQSAVARLIKDPQIPASLDSEWQQLLAAMTARNPQDRPSTPEVTRALYDQTVNGRGKHKVDTAVIPGNQDARAWRLSTATAFTRPSLNAEQRRRARRREGRHVAGPAAVGVWIPAAAKAPPPISAPHSPTFP